MVASHLSWSERGTGLVSCRLRKVDDTNWDDSDLLSCLEGLRHSDLHDTCTSNGSLIDDHLSLYPQLEKCLCTKNACLDATIFHRNLVSTIFLEVTGSLP